MKVLQIILLCVASAVAYGVLHDQVTARVCIEYFTVFHPPVFRTASPTLLGLGWGVIATWWVGLPLGVLLAIAARAGTRHRKLSAGDLMRPVAYLLLGVGAAALLAGVSGWWLAVRGVVVLPEWLAASIPSASQARFMGDWWAHNASYACATIGGVGLSVLTWRRRRGMCNESA
jgi:hypothetical protein